MNRAFEDAVIIVLDRYDIGTIKPILYKFFKENSDNKIV